MNGAPLEKHLIPNCFHSSQRTAPFQSGQNLMKSWSSPKALCPSWLEMDDMKSMWCYSCKILTCKPWGPHLHPHMLWEQVYESHKSYTVDFESHGWSAFAMMKPFWNYELKNTITDTSWMGLPRLNILWWSCQWPFLCSCLIFLSVLSRQPFP